MADASDVPELTIAFAHDGAELLRLPIDVLLHVQGIERGKVFCPTPGTALRVTLRQYRMPVSFTFQVPDRSTDDA